MNQLLYRLLCGFLIGVGCILPGVSGGVMAVSFGLYQPALEAMTGVFRNTKKHLFLLAPLALGGLLGLLMGAEGLSFAINRWETPTLFLFLGFVLGGLPALWQNAVKHGFRPQYLWALLPGMLLLAAMFLMDDQPPKALLTPMEWLLTGGIYALGTIIPGLSASFLLIQLGWYHQTLLAFSRLMLPELCWFAVGFAAVLLLSLKLIQQLLQKWPGYAGFGVIGLLFASIVPAIPSLEQNGMLIVDLMMLGLGIAVSLIMIKLGRMGQE